MMSIIMYLLFLIPLIKNWWVVFNSFLLMSFILIMYPVERYYCHLSYSFGVDILSFWLMLLSIWICSLMVMASTSVSFNFNYPSEFLFMIIVLMIFLAFTFSTTNLFFFYLSFESIMIPTLFLIFGWGYQPERFSAGLYLLFYTLFASFPLLLGIIYLSSVSCTLFINLIVLDCNLFIYLSMIMAFLFKMPIAFFHMWLPSAHVEAPVSGSMILAGVLLKLGGYGLYRVFGFIGNYSMLYNHVVIVVSLYGSLLVSVLCLCQVDIKSLIAYSSVCHMGLVICGIMTGNLYGLTGSLILMLGHGLCSSGLFGLANIIYERSLSRSLFVNSGLMSVMPSLSMFWFLFSVNNMASPPSVNLLGELLLFNSLISWSYYTSIFLALLSFFSCCYSIYLFSATQHGNVYSGVRGVAIVSLCDYTMIILHSFPLNLLFLSSNLFIWL